MAYGQTLVSTLLPRRGARHVPAVRRRRISSLNLSEKLSAPIERIACAVQVHQQTTAEKAAAQTGRIADATHIPRKISAEKKKKQQLSLLL